MTFSLLIELAYLINLINRLTINVSV